MIFSDEYRAAKELMENDFEKFDQQTKSLVDLEVYIDATLTKLNLNDPSIENPDLYSFLNAIKNYTTEHPENFSMEKGLWECLYKAIRVGLAYE